MPRSLKETKNRSKKTKMSLTQGHVRTNRRCRFASDAGLNPRNRHAEAGNRSQSLNAFQLRVKTSAVPVEDIAGDRYDGRRRRLTAKVRAHRMIPKGRTRGLPRRSRQARQDQKGDAAVKTQTKGQICVLRSLKPKFGGENGAREHKTLMYNKKSRANKHLLYSGCFQ
jgi:hypothetical protein